MVSLDVASDAMSLAAVRLAMSLNMMDCMLICALSRKKKQKKRAVTVCKVGGCCRQARR
jgi:hypothetical protein